MQEKLGKRSPIIYYYAPANKEPCGGTRVIYRHVDILNEAGFCAFVLHDKKRYRAHWFQNKTPIVYGKKIEKLKIADNDFFVIPELYGPHIVDKITAKNIVVFNQNSYNTFRGGYNFDLNCLANIYSSPKIRSALVVSQDSQEYLSYVFPTLAISRTHLSINHNQFYYTQSKKKQIAIMTRKLSKHSLQIINILKQHQIFNEYSLVIIDQMSEEQTAKIMRESLIFLSFSDQEGFGLPPAEAMACGCITIGYHGEGGKEYMLPHYSFPISGGNIIEFAKTIETIMQEYKNNPERLEKLRKDAAGFILARYSAEQEKKDVVEFWVNVLK
jgi:glycosyltransferase involved in cell wall biosynthesis